MNKMKITEINAQEQFDSTMSYNDCLQ